MKRRDNFTNIVSTPTFIDAIRDAGYRGPAAALAEMIDNSFEANATAVRIFITDAANGDPVVTIADNGSGMTPAVLEAALQFGGSTRFGSRTGLGRYGMGLPAGSMSQATRVDVYTWTQPGKVWWSYLDIEEIRTQRLRAVPAPARRRYIGAPASPRGTVIVWSNCDKLRGTITSQLLRAIALELGRTFREYLWSGRDIWINGEMVTPVDPMFRDVVFHQTAAAPFGPPLSFEVALLDTTGTARTSQIEARFFELPIEEWHLFSNAEKRMHGISKRAGVSILRAQREIDHGWFFMGGKRCENYDDWWRCELRFEPLLDEFFGVTHTKQGIHPTPQLQKILSPHFERVARDLNARARRRFTAIRDTYDHTRATRHAEKHDYLLEPPRRQAMRLRNRGGVRKTSGLHYRIEHTKLEDASFFVPRLSGGEVRVVLNEEHPFFRAVYGETGRRDASADPHAQLELVLLAAARAETRVSVRDRAAARKLREHWSEALAAFLS